MERVIFHCDLNSFYASVELLSHPELKSRIGRISMMGGGIRHGNWTPAAEFNILVDPEAAELVFRSGVPITMAGLDVTEQVRLTAEHTALLEKYALPETRAIAAYIRQAMDFYFTFNRMQNNCLDHCPVHDPLAVLVALDPSLVQTRKMPARVECGGTFCRGMVVTDLREYPMDAPLLTICTQVDGRRAVEKLLAAFTR